MITFWTLLPLYLVGNLHCIGMCGPLVMVLGQNRFRGLYFLGRVTSYLLVGAFAGLFGAVVHYYLNLAHLSALLCFMVGALMILSGIFSFIHSPFPFMKTWARWLQPLNQNLTKHLLQEDPRAFFWIGFLTVFLPCGQTVIVFSAIALEGSLWSGLFNGACFALLTSPSLWMSMQAHHWLRGWRDYYKILLSILSCLVGGVTILRGCADWGWIEHLALNSPTSSVLHIVLY